MLLIASPTGTVGDADAALWLYPPFDLAFDLAPVVVTTTRPRPVTVLPYTFAPAQTREPRVNGVPVYRRGPAPRFTYPASPLDG